MILTTSLNNPDPAQQDNFGASLANLRHARGGYLTMTNTRQPGVRYEVQSAATLQPALPEAFSPATTTLLIDNATTLKARDNARIGTAPARFIRTKVTAAP